MNSTPTTEERIWAVFSHLSALAFGMGIFLPILGWSEQRRKSSYATFQCLQALGYQSLGYTVWLLSYLLVLAGWMVLVIIMSFRAERNGQAFDPLEGPATTLVFVVAFAFLGLYMILPVVAAVACALGRDYRYPVLGNRLARYLGYPPAGQNGEDAGRIEEHEVRWVAAMGHFSVIIPLWGLLAPVTAWILQGRQSVFLGFQSIQTTVYQAFVSILYLVAGIMYIVGAIIVFAVIGQEGNLRIESPAGMISILLLFVSFLLAALILLAIPLFHILGQWAGYRLLKGGDYRYPLIGRLVDRWVKNDTPLAGDGGLSREGNF